MFLLKFGKGKIEEKLMTELNAWGAKVYGDAYAHYSQMAKEESENVFTIFDDWWHGKCVTAEEYKSKFTEEENCSAGSIILTAVSNGFG